MTTRVLVAVFAGFSVLNPVTAKEWHVYAEPVNGVTGNQQLTNAFIQAQSGDTITIHKGTYNLATEELIFPYSNESGEFLGTGTCLYSVANNLTVQGDPQTAREEIILSGVGDTVSGDGKHAIMRLVGEDTIVRNLTFFKGRANTSGAIYWNGKVMNTGDTSVYRRAGGLFMLSSGVCSNCVFDSCYAFHGAALVGGAEAVDCVFVDNNNVANNAGCAVYETGIVRDSLFEENSRGAVRGCGQMISNCVFRANRHNGGTGLFYYMTGALIDCVFSNNTTVCVYLHGAKYMPKEIRGCRFEDNTCGDPFAATAGIGGTVPCTTPVVDCTFIGPNQINDFNARISDCRFIRNAYSKNNHFLKNCPVVEDCEFTATCSGVDLEGQSGYNVSVVSNCVLNRCHIHNIDLYNGWIFLDVPAMTNCLVEANTFWGYSEVAYFGYTDGRNAEIVNCTVVSNNGAQGFWNAGTGIVTFRNTLFFNNKISGKAWRQRDISETEGMGSETIRMINSIYKSPLTFEGVGSSNMYGHWDWYPQFMIDRYPHRVHEHPYALNRDSPCLDKGVNDGWTADDIDLAGNKRLNGIVDIGCYENWYVAPGLKVVFR